MTAQAPSDTLPPLLLVDDSDIILRTVTRILGRGYAVTTASHGRQALELVRAGARFDVIVCDVAMPHMNGVEFYKTLVRDHPDQASRFMFATGGAETLRSMGWLLDARVRVLLKPFTAASLREAIESIRRAPAAPRTISGRLRRVSSAT
jgi:CheY-like chemotaxis protein